MEQLLVLEVRLARSDVGSPVSQLHPGSEWSVQDLAALANRMGEPFPDSWSLVEG